MTHKQLIQALRRAGYGVELARSGHVKVRRPNGSYMYTLALSPSDVRAIRNAICELRKLGFDYEEWKR